MTRLSEAQRAELREAVEHDLGLPLDGHVRSYDAEGFLSLLDEVEALRKALAGTVTAWEALPGNRNYDLKTVERWICGDMWKSINAARRALSDQTEAPE